MIHHEERKGLEDRVSCEIVGAAIEVHRRLGRLLESAYEACGYRLDILVKGAVVVDVKSVAQILPIRRAWLMT